mmetsp:Transcript_53864/g.136769  ORF Transcript_53864/g.136769 Transcript_53864/m.136769 type:complete len:336 (-) Transcript_53864:90-1097(-)
MVGKGEEVAEVEVDGAEEKRRRKAAKRAAAAAAEEMDAAEAKKQKKAAKKAAAAAAAAEEEAAPEAKGDVEDAEARKQRKAAKRAAREAAAEGRAEVQEEQKESDVQTPPTKKKKNTEETASKEKDSNGTETPKKEADDSDPNPYRLFVGGIPWSVEEDQLRKDFSECGEIVDLKLMMDMETGKSKGIAFITYSDEAGFQAALKFDGKEYAGRKLNISKANSTGGKSKGKGKGKDGKGKGKGKFDPNRGKGHLLPRNRITAEKFTGTVTDWKGKYGWIQPAEEVQHEKAAKHQGRLFVSKDDLEGGAEELAPGTAVEFHIWEDSTGLGAEEVVAS